MNGRSMTAANQATLYARQATLDGARPGKPRRAQDGVCVAPKGYECNLELHEGGKCKTRPCKHCMPGCMYWRSGR